MAQATVPVCYDISRYLTDKNILTYFGNATPPPGTPPNGPPKKLIFERLNLGCQFILISVDI